VTASLVAQRLSIARMIWLVSPMKRSLPQPAVPAVPALIEPLHYVPGRWQFCAHYLGISKIGCLRGTAVPTNRPFRSPGRTKKSPAYLISAPLTYDNLSYQLRATEKTKKERPTGPVRASGGEFSDGAGIVPAHIMIDCAL